MNINIKQIFEKIVYNKNKKKLLEKIKSDEVSVMCIPKIYWDDEDVVLEAVKRYGYLLQYASDRVRDDSDIALTAIKCNWHSARCVSDRLQDNKDFIIKAMKVNPEVLSYFSTRLNNDEDILEFLEESSLKSNESWWYKERMNVLNNIRNQKDKEYMENSILLSNKKIKKIKF